MIKLQMLPISASISTKLPKAVLPLAGLLALASAGAASAQVADLSATVRPQATDTLLAREAPPAASSSSLTNEAPEAALPEAPQPQLALNPRPKSGSDPAQKIARKKSLTIPYGWHAQPLTAHDKVVAGAQDLYSFQTVAAIFISAGYEQIINSAPNYGTDKGAFGQRLGAAAIREVTQNAFSEMVFAPVLHEDSRYYVEGPKYNFIHRTVYAITRPLITRTDNGSATVNGALLLGYAASAALTPAYYPQSNRNFHDVAAVYGGSIGGSALGYFITEFSQDTLRALHLSRRP